MLCVLFLRQAKWEKWDNLKNATRPQWKWNGNAYQWQTESMESTITLSENSGNIRPCDCWQQASRCSRRWVDFSVCSWTVPHVACMAKMAQHTRPPGRTPSSVFLRPMSCAKKSKMTPRVGRDIANWVIHNERVVAGLSHSSSLSNLSYSYS